MVNPIIEIKSISKKYKVKEKQRYLAFRDIITNYLKKPFEFLKHEKRNPLSSREDFWALKDITFDVKKGEVIGIIGRNGAGKTTLLKVLSRITCPTKGKVYLRGRVASLLEVGTGIHPELTGRENIYFNGSILGMKKGEIDKKFDEIVAFAEVEKFIETPVKRFSSGMQVRLSFAVAAHLEPEILLVDEVLAVGDIMFQKKCLGKMDDVAKEGRTVLFVSHNMDAIQRLCPRTLLIHDGSLIEDGPTSEIIKTYLQVGLGEQGERVWDDARKAPGDEVVRLHSIRIMDKYGKVCTDFDVRDPVVIEMKYLILEEGYSINTSIGLINEKGHPILYSFDNLDSPWRNTKRPVSLYRCVCKIPGNFLNNGQISLNVGVVTHPHPVHASVSDVLRFNVKDSMDPRGVRGNMPREWPAATVRPRLSWTVEREPLKQHI